MSTIAGIIGWIVFGLIVGLLARFIVPGRQALGFIGTVLLGIAGSFAGGFVVFLIHGGQAVQSTSFLGSLVGAVVVLWIAHSSRSERV